MNQEWTVLDHKNTGNSEAQWSFLLCLNVSCILSTCVCFCVWVGAGCHSVSGMFCERGHWQVFSADIIAAHLPLRAPSPTETMWVFTNRTSCNFPMIFRWSSCSWFTFKYPVTVWLLKQTLTWGQSLKSSIHTLSLSGVSRCQVAHIVLNLDAKKYYQWMLLRAKMAAYGLGRVHSCWGVVLLARVSWETPQHVTVLWQWFIHCTEDLAAKWIRSPGPKQETGERTRGRLMFRARIQIVSLCVSENQERGGCLWLCEAVSFKTAKSHTCIHTQTPTFRLYCSSICLPLAVQFEGVDHCYGRPKQNAGWLFSGWSDNSGTQKSSTEAQPLPHTPLQLAVKLGPFTTLEASEDIKRCTQGGLPMHAAVVFTNLRLSLLLSYSAVIIVELWHS